MSTDGWRADGALDPRRPVARCLWVMVVVMPAACWGTGGGSDTSTAGLPVSHIEVFDIPYDTVDELFAAAETVLVGAVSSVDSLGVLDIDEAPEPSEWVVVTVEPSSVLKGDPAGDRGLRLGGFRHRRAGQPHDGVHPQRRADATPRRRVPALPGGGPRRPISGHLGEDDPRIGIGRWDHADRRSDDC